MLLVFYVQIRRFESLTIVLMKTDIEIEPTWNYKSDHTSIVSFLIIILF